MTESRYIVAQDGFPLRRRGWTGKKGHPVAYVSHAQPTHSANFHKLCNGLNQLGWAVHAGDIRGHGESTSATVPVGHLPVRGGWRTVVDDLQTHLAASFQGVEWRNRVVIAANISALAILDVLKRQPDLARNIVLLSTPKNQPSVAAMARAFAKARMVFKPADEPDEHTLHHLYTFLGAHLKNRQHLAELMTPDRAVIDELIADPYAWPTPTLAYWSAIFEGYQNAWKWPRGMQVKAGTRVLGLWGEEDTFARRAEDIASVRDWFTDIGVGEFCGRFIPGGRQAFYLDAGCPRTIETIELWMGEGLGADLPEPASAEPAPHLQTFYDQLAARLTTHIDDKALEPDELVELCYNAINDETRWVDMLYRLELAQGDEALAGDALDNLVAKVMPDWDRAFQLNKQVMASATMGVLLQSLVDRLDLGVAVLTDARDLVHGNAAFGRALNNLGLVEEGEHASIGLRRLLADGKLHECRTPGEKILSFDGRHLGFIFRPRALNQTALQRSGPSAMLVLRVPDEIVPEDTARGEFLELVYGLTRQEATIAFQIAGGHSPDAVARTLGVSINTIRTHLKRCYEKMDVDGQTDMVSRLLSGPLGWLSPRADAGPVRKDAASLDESDHIEAQS